MHGALAPAVRDRRRGRRRGARARCERLPHPALPDEDGEVSWRVGAHELDVRALGEALVPLTSGPERRSSSRSGSPEDRVGVADRHRRELEALAVELERLRAADVDLAEVDLDVVALQRAPGSAARRAARAGTRRRSAWRARAPRSRAVPGQLGPGRPGSSTRRPPQLRAPRRPRGCRPSRSRTAGRTGGAPPPGRAERRARPARRAGRRYRARATSRIALATSSGGRSASIMTMPGMRRIHFRW